MKNIFKAFIFMILTFVLCIPAQIVVKASTYTNMNSKKDVSMNFNTKGAPYLKISSVQDILVNLEEGGKYTFPKTVQAIMSDNSKKVVQVEWPQGLVYLNKSGTYTYEGVIKNYNKKAKTIIKVSKKQTTKFIVCINPARGGNDSGSIGPTKLKEKDVNLDVALRLGKLLKKENIQVVYTRTGDNVTWNSSNEIQARMNIANNAKSDLLVTISCNSYPSETTNGIETFYLNGNGKGKQLAEYIQTQLVSKTAALDRGAKAGDYNSLKLSKAPGAMATLGFITNKSEESKLKTTAYKDKLALAFTEAVKKYISVNPKYGSGNGDINSGNVYMNDITINIKKGDKYILPLKVKVTTESGTEKEVAVVWDIKTLDTSKVGVYTFKGTIKESTKKAGLVVNVIESTKPKYKVVLDAGHGGYDAGASGPTGIDEKTVTLGVTLKVGNILAKNGVEVIYTRISDNITWSTNEAQNLQARCDISNKAKPDYFVSIHVNSFSNPASRGIETYYSKGSASAEKLAQTVQNELIKETGRVDRNIKTAGYYVLNNVDTTAILVETSFISNPEEEKLLATEGYQNKLAKAISTGILKNLGITKIIF